MPILTTTVLTDRATPPVDHTFTAYDVEPNGVGVLLQTNGVLLNAKRLTLSMRKNATSKKMKGRLTLTIPVVQNEVINGISRPITVRTGYASIDVSYDIASTPEERRDLIGMLASALESSKTFIQDALVKGESVR